MPGNSQIEKDFERARDRYASLGVDAAKALSALGGIPLALHCWQGDDVTGFENQGTLADAGIQATGNYPGKARTADELRSDIDKALSLIPGKHRLNLHAIYAETSGRFVDRNELRPEHFQGWIDWARTGQLGLDFNGTFFAHPKAAAGFTLSSPDEGIRRFWVEHGMACREIGAAFGKQLVKPCITNVWIPDGFKDIPVDRKSPRERLQRSLDEMFSVRLDPRYNRDAVEGKLFGIGSESFVVGSHEFYLGYSVKNAKLLCIDSGHYHPTEEPADKISAVLMHLEEILLHVSRGVRWDSDHVVILSDQLLAIAQELVRGDFIGRVHIGLDYFDASINRVAAWVIGMRAMQKALLIALLEPIAKLRELELSGDFTGRLALLEECKALPFGAVWDYHCLAQNVPPGFEWLDAVKRYEAGVQSRR